MKIVGHVRPRWFVRIFGGNYAYWSKNGYGLDFYAAGWRPNIFRLTMKWYREGWWRGGPIARTSWKEMCWKMP